MTVRACIHCGGRGEVYDDTCGAWEPCPVKCEAWFRVVADDAVPESLETAYVPAERVQTLSDCVCPEHGLPVDRMPARVRTGDRDVLPRGDVRG